ncbi:MAG: magnesium/cobalt transporter CorA [Burkholderiales bacterium]|jgi:magnesium transporter|nr:magnesium/cobalt transporter CorA [Burkholderiales bacterium]
MLDFFTLKGTLLSEIEQSDADYQYNINRAVWIDSLTPSQEEKNILQHTLKDLIPDADDVDDIEDSARRFVDQTGIHVHSLFLSNVAEKTETVSVACILQSDKLVTIRDDKIADFRLFRLRAKRGQISCNSPAEILLNLMEQKVENLADYLEDQHRQLEEVSTLVLSEEIDNPEEVIYSLAESEDLTGKIRLCLMDTQRDISFLQRHSKQMHEYHDTYREIVRDIDTLLSHTTFLFDKINFLMSFLQGYINIEQNKIVKIFTIASVVFLPPTLVASIYGMNFEAMPELKMTFGYPWALGLMVLSGFAPYWYFKKKGWL